jgi:hypothetical protein
MSDKVNPSFPSGVGIAARGLANGNIEIHVIDKGQSLCGCSIPANEAGYAVAAILIAAHQAVEASRMAPSIGPSQGELPVIRLTGFYLDDSLEPGFVTLRLQIGEAHIGFELEPDAIAPLGNALLDRASDEKIN